MQTINLAEYHFSTCLSEFSTLLAEARMTDLAQQVLTLNSGLNAIVQTLKTCRANKGTVYIIGNGGSAAIASHVVIDLMNMDAMKAMALQDPSVVTCMANDYGYEQVYAKQLEHFIAKQDVLIAISSSGNSQNILNAVHAAKVTGAPVITFSGFSAQNRLRQCGDFNIWLNASHYGQVEMGHAFILHHVTDRLCVK